LGGLIESIKDIIFMLKFSALFIILDFLFFKRWKKFVRVHSYNKLLYQIPIWIGIAMFLLSLYAIYIQIFKIIPTAFENLLFSIMTLWYIPKFLIVPVQLAIDIPRYLYFSKNFVEKNYLFWKQMLKKFGNTLLSFKPLPKLQMNLDTTLAFETNSDFELRENFNDFKIEEREKEMFKNRKEENQENLKPNKNRREFLKIVGWSTALLPFGSISYGAVSTTYNFKIMKDNIFINDLPSAFEGVKIVQISDIHAGSYITNEPMKEVVHLINNIKPDLVFLTGDFVNFNDEEYDIISDNISQIRSTLGNYGCLGNHDHFMPEKSTRKLVQKIEASNVQMLNNQNTTITINGQKLQIAGVDNTGYGQNFGDFHKANQNTDEDYPIIWLVHDPTNWDPRMRNKLRCDLVLSGHTHGGQIGLNVLGNVITPARFVYKQWAGLYQEGNSQLYVNRGLGTTGFPIRISVPPEITEITLRKK
jgi:predicted MPP superfamily phosphohydrolase